MNLLPLGERKFFPYHTETKQDFCFIINSSKWMDCVNKEKKIMFLDITEEEMQLLYKTKEEQLYQLASILPLM